ncbi:MAG: hypothetical protein RJA21_669, partial [Gemmatimonadota bacterium]
AGGGALGSSGGLDRRADGRRYVGTESIHAPRGRQVRTIWIIFGPGDDLAAPLVGCEHEHFVDQMCGLS